VEYIGPPVELAEQILGGDAGLPEDEPPCPSAARSHQAVDILDVDSRAALYEEGADPAVRRRGGVGAGIDQEEVGAFRPDDEALLPAEDEVVAGPRRRRRRPEEIGAAARFGQRLGGGEPPGEHRAEDPLLLPRRGELRQRLSDNRD
jgi:hypothetical protein